VTKIAVSSGALLIDGAPALLQAGALHYFRLPHPDLWRPVLERMRMGGQNAVWVPFPWAYHSPAPGFHDFTGPRDLERLLDEIARVGLWLVAYVGPWVGMGLDAGGVPAWFLRQREALPRCAGDALSGPSPVYLRHVTAWWAALFAQLRGHANLLALAIDPGLCAGGAPLTQYQAPLLEAARSLANDFGLQVPCASPHEQEGRRVFALLPSRPGVRESAPQAAEAPPSTEAPPSAEASLSAGPSPSAESFPSAGPSLSAEAPPSAGPPPSAGAPPSPGASPSLGASPFIVLLDTTGEPDRQVSRDAAAWPSAAQPVRERSLASLLVVPACEGLPGGALDPVHRGVNWGWWAGADVPTLSGDGAPIDEGAATGDRYYDARRMALTLETLGRTLSAARPFPDLDVVPPAALGAAREGPAGIVAFLRGVPESDGYAQLGLRHAGGTLAAEDVPLPATGARALPMDWPLAEGRLLSTTLEPVLHTVVAGRELLILCNEVGGEVLLSDDYRPRHRRGGVYTERVEGGLVAHFDPGRLGSLVLDSPGGALSSTLQLLALAPDLAGRAWPLDDTWRSTPAPPAVWTPSPEAPARGVVIGPDFVLPEAEGGFRFLAADRGLGYRWGPWRGSDPHTWLAPLNWTARGAIALPALTWESRPGAPEALPGYDDADWARATPESGLLLERHGVSCGFAWYRGSFEGPATSAIVASRDACDVFLNGAHIASLNPRPVDERSSSAPVDAPVSNRLPLPARYLHDVNVLAVLVEHHGRPMSWDRAALPHGLVECRVVGESTTEDGLESDRAVRWRVRGGLAGEVSVQGFYGFADWPLVPGAGSGAVTWHRAGFELRLPRDVEMPVFLHLDQTPARAYIYLNGQLIGRQVFPRGSQRRFWLPDGLLRRQGVNELLIAQWCRGAEPGIGAAHLMAGPPAAWHAAPGA